MANAERERLFEVAAELGWSDRGKGPNRKGYIKLFCPCDKHITWIAKTPSNPNYYRERASFMRSRCGRE
ncbi:MAG: hypothetical protein ACRDY3_03205 [Acidimicrobiales bacterium]